MTDPTLPSGYCPSCRQHPADCDCPRGVQPAWQPAPHCIPIPTAPLPEPPSAPDYGSWNRIRRIVNTWQEYVGW